MTTLLARFSALRLLLAALTLAGGVAFAFDMAEARPGGGFSVGSRGFRTFTPPPITKTAPKQAAPIERSMTQPGKPSIATAQPQRSNMFRNLLLGGLIGGLLGSIFGFGALASVLGFLVQTALIGGLIYLAVAWWRSRQQPATSQAGMGYSPGGPGNSNPRGANTYATYSPSAGALGGGNGAAAGGAISLKSEDFDAFERLLGEVQTAYGKEDVKTLETRVTPEMGSYFREELEQNKRKGVVNRIAGVKLLQGDLAEAWREPGAEFATVAMRYAITDTLVDRNSGRVVGGSERSLSREAHICAGVPSNMRPQPRENSVSPQRTACSSANQ